MIGEFQVHDTDEALRESRAHPASFADRAEYHYRIGQPCGEPGLSTGRVPETVLVLGEDRPNLNETEE
jgi:hypothetical protein